MKKSIKIIFEKLLYLLYPRHCILCDCLAPNGICENCSPKIRYLSGNTCRICSRPIRNSEDLCKDCSANEHEFNSGKAVLSYEGIADSVYRFKYNKRAEYSVRYARIIYDELKDWLEYIKPDALIPVPLHKKREIKRGYNQAGELSKELSKLTNIPTQSNVVYRIKNTLPQKNNDRLQRQNNVKKAFIVRGNDVKLEIVVIIDDIYTTGSTIDAISRELRRCNVQKIYFVTLTIAGT